jgi:hypothetical protein
LEPLSGSSSAPQSATVSFRTPDNTTQGSIIVANATNTATTTIDASRFVQQQQQGQAQAHASAQPSGQASGASGSSQPGSLDSLLNYMGSLPISSLYNAIDTNTIQSFLEPGISFSSNDGGSNSLAENAAQQQQQQDSANQPDFLEVQAAIESLNK